MMALMERLPESVDLSIYTSAPEWLFRQNLARPFRFVSVDLDVGTVQRDCFHPDADATLSAFAALWESRHARVVELADDLREHGVSGALIDIAPLAMEACFVANVPAVAISNFTWDWIYEPFVASRPHYRRLLDEIRAAHGRVEALFRLPLHGEMRGFRRIVPVGHLFRPPRASRQATRDRLHFDPARVHVLISFGGLGEKRLPFDAMSKMGGYQFHLLQDMDEPTPPNLSVYPNGTVYHPDLVQACDVVLGKLGYGLVAECLSSRRPIVYVPRTGFAEHDVFVAELPARLPILPLSEEDFLSGRWLEALEAILRAPLPPPGADLDGARDILGKLGSAPIFAAQTLVTGGTCRENRR
ncbi:hypothetical protein HS125_09265 [bacterium]|nr:hypothetical protein [bacterium]